MLKYRNKEWLRKKYKDEKLSAIKIAKICNAGSTTIYRWLDKFGIHIRFAGEYNLGKKRKPFTEETRNKIRNKKIGTHPSKETIKILSKIRKGTHLSKKTKEKISKLLRGEKNPNYGKHLSKEIREKMSKKLMGNKRHLGISPSKETRAKQSKAMTGRMPLCIQSSGTQWGHIKRGYFDIGGKQMFFRSKWEANVALYLNFLVKQKQIKSWSYEKKVFVFEEIKFGTRSYCPDFEIINNDGSVEYHEVKGYMTQKSKTQLKRMAKYYPEVKLILIDQKYYQDIKNKVGRMLCFY